MRRRIGNLRIYCKIAADFHISAAAKSDARHVPIRGAPSVGKEKIAARFQNRSRVNLKTQNRLVGLRIAQIDSQVFNRNSLASGNFQQVFIPKILGQINYVVSQISGSERRGRSRYGVIRGYFG